jgi:hypothetical protein
MLRIKQRTRRPGQEKYVCRLASTNAVTGTITAELPSAAGAIGVTTIPNKEKEK